MKYRYKANRNVADLTEEQAQHLLKAEQPIIEPAEEGDGFVGNAPDQPKLPRRRRRYKRRDMRPEE